MGKYTEGKESVTSLYAAQSETPLPAHYHQPVSCGRRGAPPMTACMLSVCYLFFQLLYFINHISRSVSLYICVCLRYVLCAFQSVLFPCYTRSDLRLYASYMSLNLSTFITPLSRTNYTCEKASEHNQNDGKGHGK